MELSIVVSLMVIVTAPVPPPTMSTPLSPPLRSRSFRFIVIAAASVFSMCTPLTADVLLTTRPVMLTFAESTMRIASTVPPSIVPASPTVSVVLPIVIAPPVLFSS